MPHATGRDRSLLRRFRASPASRIAPLLLGLTGIALFSSSPAPGIGFAVLVFAIALALALVIDAAAARRDQHTGPSDH
ncbi:hypothetical protein [uncultured Pseudokineococcus sp.]|uniref:hypothetical protein n=1 Tax=uncultured Pseudokineococcus sp. TaxID=1642928 RepID=UPI002624904B|nr:hypothetical protein [uncultured Pseudokineococcus sp.]